MLEAPKFSFTPKILYACEDYIRHQGSSGGIVTQIVKYLFKTNQIESVISFKFAGVNLFEPYIASCIDEYLQVGSIYHEVEICKYLKQQIASIRSPILITCLPCQIVPIKFLLDNHNINSFIISLVCSSQLSKDATYYFLNKNNIDIKRVKEFRYRGNGWPSGIQVKTDEKEYFFHNNTSKWQDVFNSQIFTLKRCFTCIDSFGLKADLSVGDPWLERYILKDNVGSSIVIPHTKNGEYLIEVMLKDKYLHLVENVTDDDIINSQKGTLRKKYIYLKYRKLFSFLVTVFKSKYYKHYFYTFSSLHRFVFFKIIGALKRFEDIF